MKVFDIVAVASWVVRGQVDFVVVAVKWPSRASSTTAEGAVTVGSIPMRQMYISALLVAADAEAVRKAPD